jgi:hypothetical protein
MKASPAANAYTQQAAGDAFIAARGEPPRSVGVVLDRVA